VPSHRSAIALEKVETMSVAFTREESAETAAEVELPDRPISPHPNLVTESGLEALANALAESHAVYNAAQQIEDAGERRRALTFASRAATSPALRRRTQARSRQRRGDQVASNRCKRPQEIAIQGPHRDRAPCCSARARTAV
jgi:hypothetical protein